MKVASLSEIKKELQTLDQDAVTDLCLRLARYKKESKELLNYLLFEANDEGAYVRVVKDEMITLFSEIPQQNVYFMKKSLRRILRIVNRQIKFSGQPATELELRICFCTGMKEKDIPMKDGTVLYNLYQQQLKKIDTVFNKLPEDLQADYQREVESIS